MSRKDYSELSRSGKRKRIQRNLDSLFLQSASHDTVVEDIPCAVDLSDAHEDFNTIPNDSLFQQSASNVIENDLGSQSVDDSDDLNSISDIDDFSDEENEGDPCPSSAVTRETESNENDEDPDLRQKIAHWAVYFNINTNALSALLIILNLHHCFSFPTDGRTLLKSPRSVSMCEVKPGLYSHIGLSFNLRQLIQSVKCQINSIVLHIHVDGLPLFESSSGEFWPILGSISNVPSLQSIVFPIGIYFGKSKPECSSTYLKAFITEAKELIQNGLLIAQRVVQVSIGAFICDAPAKAYILGIKNHNGYSSCTRCTVTGSYVNNRMTFPNIDCSLRTHDAFINREDLEYQTKDTTLVQIPGLHFVNSFSLDYLHVVCLGVMKTLLSTWVLGNAHPCKFPSIIINKISMSLIALYSHFPCEFNRKPRGLNELKRWKGTELRSFLLYSGPVVLLSNLSTLDNGVDIYNHFLSLSLSMIILLSPKFSLRYKEHARELLIHFVKTTQSLYGTHFLTHNFHALIHIADDVDTFGPLDNCSSFKYENFLQFFKNRVRKSEKPLQQVVKRLTEMSNANVWFQTTSSSSSNTTHPSFSRKHRSGPTLSTTLISKQFQEVHFSSFKLSLSQSDSCCSLKNGTIVLIKNIVFSNFYNGMCIIYMKFQKQEHFFEHPFTVSSVFGIYVVSELSSDIFESPIDEINQKIVLLPCQTKFVAFPLIHC